MTSDNTLRRATAAILDGTPVDWDALESSADPSILPLLQQLRVLADVSAVHRLTPGCDPGETGTASSGAATALSLQRTESAPNSWGPLQIIDRIGHGAFGQVYRAWDSRLDRTVALKLLDLTGTPDDERAGHVVEEGRLIARVRHPNVAVVYGADRFDGRVGLWMEFIEGRTLEEVVATEGPLPPDEVVRIGLDLCGALAAVHAARLLHQDVKAQNVMLEASGRVVLMDFGAGVEQPASEVDADRRSVAGTPLYLAPERFDGQPPSVQSDVYSLGVVLYHLATGRYPVEGASLRELREAHRVGRRARVRDRRPDMPGRLADVIDRATDPRPAGRFESAATVAAALQQDADVVARAPSPRDEMHASTAIGARASTTASGRRRSAVLVIVAAAVTLTVVGRSSLLNRFSRPGVEVARGSGVSPAGTAQVNRQVPLPPTFVVGPPSWEAGVVPYVDGEGTLALWSPSTGQSTAVPMDTAAGRVWPSALAIHPAAREVAYSECQPDSICELRLVTVPGGSRRRLAEWTDTVELDDLEWSTDGRQLLFRRMRRDGEMELGLVDVADGAVRVLHGFRSGRPTGTSLSPDGSHVAFDLPSSADPRRRDIFLLSVSSGVTRPLVEHPSNDASPLWTPDGTRVFFLSDRSGILDGWLQVVANPTREPARVVEAFGRGWLIGFARDGALYHWRQNGTVDVYVRDLGPGARGAAAEPRPLRSRYAGGNIGPGWSPDGRALAFVSMRHGIFLEPGSRVITIHDVETGAERDLDPDLSIFPYPIQWSPDGRRLLCLGRNRRGESGIFVVDVETGAATRAADELAAHTWSRDGGEIVFTSVAPHRPRGIRAKNLSTGNDRLLAASDELGVDLVRHLGFSPDGRTLAFSGWRRGGTGGEARPTWRLGIATIGDSSAPVRALVEGADALAFVGWIDQGSEVVFARAGTQDSPGALHAIARARGLPRALEIPAPGVFVNPAQLSPDGRSMAFTGGHWKFDMWILQNVLLPPPDAR